MIDVFERLLPGIAQKLYASGLSRELVARSIDGLATAVGVLAAGALLLFLLRRQIHDSLKRIEGIRFFTVVLAALTILSLPDPVFPMRPGLDYSWQWMLNRLAFGGDRGESIVFTYGPIGWLICPSGRWCTILSALAVNLCFCVLWIWSVRQVYLSSDDGRAMAWGLVLTMFFPQQSMEWRWIVLAVVLTRVSWFAAGAVAAILSLMKFSSIVIALGTQVFLLVADRQRKIANYILGLIGTFVVLAVFSFPTPSALLQWLSGSIQIASGYNQYMLLEKNVIVLLVPILAFLILVHRPRHFLAILPIAPLLFCAAKYNWVRQGIGPFLYVLTVAAAFLMERFASCRRHLVMASVVFVLIGYGVVWPWHFASGQTYIAFPYGIHPMGLIRSLALPKAMTTATERAKILLEGSELPPRIRQAIGNSTVQLLGHEFSPAMIDPTLKIVPYATMQMYSTYTEKLDAIAANSYSLTNAPTYIVIDTANLSIDSKNAFIDCPRTWAAIRSNYSLRDKTPDGRWLLLSRRDFPLPILRAKRIEVSAVTPFENLLSVFFRGRIRFVELETVDGRRHIFRANPLVLGEPVEADLPLEVNELVTYFSASQETLNVKD